jgi:hypothetical protein
MLASGPRRAWLGSRLRGRELEGEAIDASFEGRHIALKSFAGKYFHFRPAREAEGEQVVLPRIGPDGGEVFGDPIILAGGNVAPRKAGDQLFRPAF